VKKANKWDEEPAEEGGKKKKSKKAKKPRSKGAKWRAGTWMIRRIRHVLKSNGLKYALNWMKVRGVTDCLREIIGGNKIGKLANRAVALLRKEQERLKRQEQRAAN
jgi:hypothetical protein